ncbi:MAG: RNA polymerase sigma factor [Acidobacteriota bacterium]|nr:RNA polymerase sigma factor [Acidobacteriota bacterium]
MQLERVKNEEFEGIFEEHKNAVYQFAWRMSNSSTVAEDITQDVFLALLRGEVQLQPSRGSLKALLLGVARNLVWKRWRQDRRWSLLDEEAFVATPLIVENLRVQEAVSAAVGQLPPLQRETLILATYEELSAQEIAETLAMEVGTVKARLHRARENMKRMLAPFRSAEVRIEKKYGTAE